MFANRCLCAESAEKFVRTKIFGKFKFIEFTIDMCSDIEIYLRAALREFGYDSTQPIDVEIFDQYNTPIPANKLHAIIKQFIASSDFFVRLAFKMDEDSGFDLAMEEYMNEHGCRLILAESKDSFAKHLDDSSDNILSIMDIRNIHIVCDCLIQFLQDNVELDNRAGIEKICHSAVRLMPDIEMKLLYDHKRKKGILYNKLSYQKYGLPMKRKNRKKANELEELPVEDAIDQLSLEEELDSLLFLKTCVVSRNKDMLKLKMKNTIELREKVIKKHEAEFFEMFPFYFVDPDLILYDFTLRFVNVDPESLVNKWHNIKGTFLRLLSKEEIVECDNMKYDVITTSFFLLLRSLVTKKQFSVAASKANVNANPEDLIGGGCMHPFILAIGPSTEKITQYYIAVENRLIPLPANTDFLATFDLFMKCHKVFHIHYLPELVRLMDFIDYFVFQNKDDEHIEVNIKMTKIAQKINLA